MIKIPNRTLTILIYISLLLTVIYSFRIYLYYQTHEIFGAINGFYGAVLTCGILLAVHDRDSDYYKQSTISKQWSRLSMLLLVIQALVTAIFILKMSIVGFLSDEIFYWQISSLVLAPLSIFLNIKVLVDLLKHQHPKK